MASVIYSGQIFYGKGRERVQDNGGECRDLTELGARANPIKPLVRQRVLENPTSRGGADHRVRG